MPTNGVKHLRLISATAIGLALVAVLLTTINPAYRSPAPLPARLEKPVHDLRAEVPLYCSLLNHIPLRARPVLVPGWLLRRASQEYDRVAELRFQATQQLQSIGTNAWPAIPALLALLGNRDFYIRYAAAMVLGRIEADQAPDFERLKTRLENRHRPADALCYLVTGRDIYLRRHPPQVRCFGLFTMAALGPGARSSLGTMLDIAESKDEDHEVRAMALEVVYSIGSTGKDGPRALVQMSRDLEKWPDVRAAAIRAWARASPADPQLQPLLRQALTNSPGLIRVAAAETLWNLRAPAAEVLPVLTETLHHKLTAVRVASLKALARMGKAAQPAAPSIRNLLSDEKKPVRLAAKAALAGMGQDQKVPTGIEP